MGTLFDKTSDLDSDVERNIVGLSKPIDLFEDLSEGDKILSEVAHLMTEYRRQKTSTQQQLHSFHFTAAIGYPFNTDNFMGSRYNDGTFPIWYGSLDLETTIYETVYHMVRSEMGIEGIRDIDEITRERMVYQVHCHAVLIDFVGKEAEHQELIGNDYLFTQQIGKRLYKEGHPGLLAPSARYSGTNVDVFNIDVLSGQKVNCYLRYHFYPRKMLVNVERSRGEAVLVIDASQFFSF